jgi:hypothetical protein
MAAQMSWDEILRGTITTYVLRGLTLLAAYLGQKGLRADDWLSPENLTILAAAIVTFGIDLTLTLYRKKYNHNVIEAARQAEPGTKFEDIKAAADQKPIVGS